MAAGTDDDDIQERMRDFMEAAQQPQPPLSNSELKRVRFLLRQVEHRSWLTKQIWVIAPWGIAVLSGLAVGWNWLVGLIRGSH